MNSDKPLETVTLVGEACAWAGNEIWLNAGDHQPVGVVKLVYNNPDDARDAYCRAFEVTIREIPARELVERYAKLVGAWKRRDEPGGDV